MEFRWQSVQKSWTGDSEAPIAEPRVHARYNTHKIYATILDQKVQRRNFDLSSYVLFLFKQISCSFHSADVKLKVTNITVRYLF